ncbi:uncharacterized protein LOC143340088 [Chaetodon auriga]|uniref:uncharacterized protein LOC143340088 n=1 Tax=Chaetodon auriga TaxID=39042 RepID=UPI004032F1A5
MRIHSKASPASALHFSINTGIFNRMAAGNSVVFLAVLTFLWTLNGGDAADAEVSCVFMKSCVLPCSFKGGSDEVIHWIQVEGNKQAHSYYYNKDQLDNQAQRFRSRTSLFNDQIPRGNASLLLTKVEVQDQGRYQCYTSTIRSNEESFINLKVEAPVHKVHIQQVENRITCSSEGIYPKPELTWSTSPPSNLTLQDKRTTQQTEQQLYNITSSLTPSDRVTDLSYTCTVSTHRNQMRATLFKSTSVNVSGSEVTIHCSPSNTPLKSLIWRFNHSHIIVNQTRPDACRVSEEWKQHMKAVSELGNLTLRDLCSSHQGVYTCESSNDEGMQVTNIFLRIRQGRVSDINVAAITAGVVVAVVLVVVAILCYKYRNRIHQTRAETTSENTEEQNRLKSEEAKEMGQV